VEALVVRFEQAVLYGTLLGRQSDAITSFLAYLDVLLSEAALSRLGSIRAQSLPESMRSQR